MPNPFDRLPPQHRLPAMIAAAAIGSTVLMIMCGGGIGLFVLAWTRPAVTAHPARPEDLPPIVGSQVQVALDNRRHGGPVQDVQISDEAKAALSDIRRLLLAAAESPNGKFFMREGSGLAISVGNHKFCTPEDNARIAARWRLVVRTLGSEGLIEPVGYPRNKYGVGVSQEWRVTTAGYTLADALSKRPGF